MLGKLIKNEFIQTSKSLIAVYSAAAAAIAVMLLSYLIKVAFIGTMGSIALVVIGAVAIVMTLVMVITNFYRSLYANQGYLTFTLPVKSSGVLFSKFLVSFVWVIVSYILMFLCILSVVLYTRAKTDGMLESVLQMLKGMEELGSLPSTTALIEYLTAIGLGSLVSVVTFVAFVFFAVTLANTRPFQKKSTFFGILIFFVCYVVNRGVSQWATIKLPLGVALTADKIKIVFQSMENGVQDALFVWGIGGKIFSCLFALVLLILTGYIMENKVNIK